jgi:hypothetical protein
MVIPNKERKVRNLFTAKALTAKKILSLNNPKKIILNDVYELLICAIPHPKSLLPEKGEGKGRGYKCTDKKELTIKAIGKLHNFVIRVDMELNQQT